MLEWRVSQILTGPISLIYLSKNQLLITFHHNQDKGTTQTKQETIHQVEVK